VSEQGQSATTSELKPGEGFVWHPLYAGKAFARVNADLIEEIGRDQRSYKLAIEAAEQSEHDSLSTIVELERRWSTFDFDWADMDPKVLADKILKFEMECERRQENISFADYRASGALVEGEQPAAAETSRTIPVMMIGLAILAVLVIILLAILL